MIYINIIKETINYYPYGSEMRMTNPAQMTNTSNKERFRFSGKELDFQNGLNMYDFGARMFDVAGVPVWTRIDPLAEDNSHVTPYSYCNGDPVNRFDPDGRDWYKNDYGNLYWNPEVRSQSNLQEGYTYVGSQFFDEERLIEYRDDGSIKYLTESEAISRMLLQKHHSTSKSNPTGKEQSAFILSDGSVLVMPDNWNNSFKSYFDKTGYSRQNHILTDSKGRNYSYVGHIHTHPLGADKGINEFSDDACFAKADPGISMFIIHADGYIYGGYYSLKRGGLDTWQKDAPIPLRRVLNGKKELLHRALFFLNL